MIGDPVLAALLLGEEMSATGDLFRCQFQPVREIVTAFNRCQPVTETVGYLTVTLRSPNLATDRTLGADTLVSELAAYLARLFVTVGFVNHPLGDTRRQVPAKLTHGYFPPLISNRCMVRGTPLFARSHTARPRRLHGSGTYVPLAAFLCNGERGQEVSHIDRQRVVEQSWLPPVTPSGRRSAASPPAAARCHGGGHP